MDIVGCLKEFSNYNDSIHFYVYYCYIAVVQNYPQYEMKLISDGQHEERGKFIFCTHKKLSNQLSDIRELKEAKAIKLFIKIETFKFRHLSRIDHEANCEVRKRKFHEVECTLFRAKVNKKKKTSILQFAINYRTRYQSDD